MFVRSTRLNLALSALFIFLMGACGNLGGCGACGSTLPLPEGKLPADQTVEGGAQIRVTPAGFNKLKSMLPALINDQLSGGFCVPQGQVGSMGTLGTGARYCTRNNGGGCNPGCKVNVALNNLTPTVVNNKLNIAISTSVATSIGIEGKIVGVGFSCTLGVSSNNLNGNFDIAFGIDQATGELKINLDRINAFHLGLDFSGCSFLSDIADFAGSVIDSFVGQFIIGLLTPAINNLLQDFLPNPLGIAGMLDVGNMMAGISPGTNGYLEARIVPGGYVDLVNNGMSLGVITGLNADEDPSTRAPNLDSEPHLCVPPLPAPNFGAPPANLPLTARTTYALGVANEFNGAPDPGADLAMGVSETTLDLAGHHAVTSGMMCLGIGTSFIQQLNVGTIGVLVPSVAELSDDGKAPLLLVTRPQRALDFTIGANTPASPAISIGIENMEVDFYAFLYERYVRAFTLDLTMKVGINLEFEQPPGQPAVITPSLVGISSQQVMIKVLNSEFVKERPEDLEAVLPSVFDLLTPLLGNLPSINVPTFAGFSLENLSIQHVTTAQDDFLALFASLGASQAMRIKGQSNPMMQDFVDRLDAELVTFAPRSTGRAKLVSTSTPSPIKLRTSLRRGDSAGLPEVVFEVDRFDSNGRELEWTYNLNGGMWRPYTTIENNQFVVRDRAFAWQGKFEIGLKSRVKGDYHTVSEVIRTPVTIDSVGPRILVADGAWNGDTYELPIVDVVSGHAIKYALGKPGDDRPSSEWFTGPVEIDRAKLLEYAIGNEVAIFAQDEVGNESVVLIAPFHGQPGETGCNCQTASGGPSAGGVVLVVLVGLVLAGGRRRSWRGRFGKLARSRRVLAIASWVGLSTVLSLVPGCSCGTNGEQTCETVADCGPDFCGDGEIPFCIDNTCVCSDDIVIGRVGPYSDVAVGADGSIWVSAYAQTYGDLVVARVEPGRVPDEAWEWVDGVPDGPVVVEGSKYRNGVSDKGDDIGMYTSIAVAPNGAPMVSYFDRETGSLKFAYKTGDTWTKIVIDEGTGMLGEFSGSVVGMYTSLSLRTDDGRPGIAYLAHVSDSTSRRAEVRYAASQVPFPTSAADWQTWVVDSAPLPDEMGVYPLPEGLGLFIDATRLSNQAPVVVYYDRANGDLKMSKFNASTGQFATPVVLDGSGNNDAGWTPSVAVGPDDVVHVAYVGATGDDLQYIKEGAAPVTVDDGYRIVGTTVDGHPKPEFHFVGDDASLVLANGGMLPMIAYQDATTQELLLATQQPDGAWQRVSLAGATDPWPGAYGFFVSDAVTANEIVISTWVINQPTRDNWVEVLKRPTAIQ